MGHWTWDIGSGITTWDTRLEEMHGIPPGGLGDNTCTYASAGHVAAIVRGSDGTTRLLDEHGDPPLDFASDFRPRQAVVEPGDTLLLYTDRLIGRRKTGLDLDGLKRACRHAPADPELSCDHVMQTLIGNNAAADDVALVAVHRRLPPSVVLGRRACRGAESSTSDRVYANNASTPR